MSTISASTTSNTAFKVTSDTTGTLVLQTGAVPTTAISIDASQVVSIGSIAVTGVTTFSAGSAAAPSITTTGDTNTGIFFPAADTIGFSEGGVESMRIDSSGNLGIGTSSPSYKLDVLASGSNPAFRINNATAGKSSMFMQSNGATVGILGLTGAIKGDSSTNFGFFAETGFDIRFYTNGSATEKAIIDTSGNLGIGTTSPVAKLDVQGILAVSNSSASYWGIDRDNSSGALTFSDSTTQRLELTTSGNLGLGVTPSAWDNTFIAFDGGASTASNGQGSLFFQKNGDFTTALGSNLYFNAGWKYKTTNAVGRFEVTKNTFQWFNAASGSADAAITFTQAMTLDASGNLLVGTTSALIGSARRGIHVLAPSGTFVAAVFANDGGNSAQTIDVWNKATSGNNAFVSFGTEASYTERGLIDYNRAAGLTRYNTTSDYRAKDILGTVQNSGATIDALKVYEGQMKDATQSRPMLIAHEAQEYAPYAVSGVKDEVKKDGTPKYQQMDVSALVPLLLAELQSVRARLAALESK